MNLKIVWEEKAKKDIKRLDSNISKRIVQKMKEIRLNTDRYIFSLVDMEVSKIRIGDYRIFANYYKEENQLIVRSIKHRKDAYKKRK